MFFRRRSNPHNVIRRPSLDFSLNGLIYCCIMMFMGLAAINSGVNLLYGVFGLMIGILIVAGVMSRRVLKKLAVHRQLPDHAVVGAAATIIYEFTNAKRFWPSLAVTVSELNGADGFTDQPQAYLLHAPTKSMAVAEAEVVPIRRGLHQFEVFQLSTSFPFGFIKRAVTDRQPDTLLVYPAIGKVDKAVLAMCRAAEHSGAAMRPRPGGQDEFYGVKEFRPGDNPRHIHWHRSARTATSTGVLVSREMTQVAPPRVLLLVDTWSPRGEPADLALVERAVAMAASLASAALEDDLSVGLLAWSGSGWKRLEPSRGKRHRGDLLVALARLPANNRHDTTALVDQGLRHVRDGATAILLTSRPAPTGLEMRRRGALLVIEADSKESERWFSWTPMPDFAAGVTPAERPTAEGASSSRIL